MKILPPQIIEYPQFNIYLVYNKIQPATLISLIGYNYQPIETITDFSYSDFFRERWKDEKTFIVIEQDIVIWPGAIEAIWNCPDRFCVYDFHLPIHRRNTFPEVRLGCTKISSDMIKKTPNLWEKDVMWDVCDNHLFKSDITIHRHCPGVVNANPALMQFVNYES